LAGHVKSLADQVKILALNMAIQLARSKEKVQDLTVLEPDFTKLIHGAIEVIQEITVILEYLQCRKPKGNIKDKDIERLEQSLNEILARSLGIQAAIESIKEKREKVDNDNR
jgi:hypothetical protein